MKAKVIVMTKTKFENIEASMAEIALRDRQAAINNFKFYYTICENLTFDPDSSVSELIVYQHCRYNAFREVFKLSTI